MTFSRGIRPSVCHITTLPQSSYDRIHGTLLFGYGANTISFYDAMSPGPVYYHKRDRDPYRWSLHVYDRRWKWRYPRIDGVYNERDSAGVIRPTGKKNLKELVDLCLAALGETSTNTSAVPTTVYPPCVWNRAKAALELEWLCDLVGMVVCLRLDNTVSVVPMNDPNGSVLPDLPVISNADIAWKSAAIPSTLRVQGDPTIIQSKLELEMVGRDTDGQIKFANQLSYKPAGGWGWPEFFDAVNQADRHRAFRYIFRWFRPISGWNGDGETISGAKQLELLEYLAETGKDSEDRERPLKAVIQGEYWPYCDHGINTPSTATYDGEFRILKDIGVVEFALPVFRWGNGEAIEPALSLITSYRVRKADQSGYATYTKDLSVTSSNATAGTKVLSHPELTKVKVVDAVYGDVTDNAEDLDTEANVYLSAANQSFSYTASTERLYEGLGGNTKGIEMDGAISQVEWVCGDGKLATTRVGRYTEFDMKTVQYRQARAMHRLSQMAERMVV